MQANSTFQRLNFPENIWHWRKLFFLVYRIVDCSPALLADSLAVSWITSCVCAITVCLYVYFSYLPTGWVLWGLHFELKLLPFSIIYFIKKLSQINTLSYQIFVVYRLNDHYVHVRQANTVCPLIGQSFVALCTL